MAVSSSTTNQKRTGSQNEAHRQAAAATLASIHEAISVAELTYFSNRSINEVEELQEEIASVIPAGNIVGLVLSGLVRLRGRSLPADQAKSDVSALMRGVEMLPRSILPKTLYGTFFAGPAAVLSAYQKLLTLAGKNPDSAFPNGLWQFYLEFALREDSARHANETIGFHKALTHYRLELSPIDQLAAWVCAVAQIYFQYDDLLHNEWGERVYLNLLEQVVSEAKLGHKLSFQRLAQAWATQRPYSRGQDASYTENYAQYRRRRFSDFLHSRTAFLPELQKTQLEEAYAQLRDLELPAYQAQMTILATLEPDQYRENRVPIPLWQARIGVILDGRYYLLPACQTDHLGRPILFESLQPDSTSYALLPNSNGDLCDEAGHLLQVDRKGQVLDATTGQQYGYLRPTYFQAVRRQIAAIFNHHAQADISGRSPARLDDQLLAIGRTERERARRVLPEQVRQELYSLKFAPIIINWDQRDGSRPLAHVRQGKRGIGDHALTIFRTDNSMVFDQSHIFYDGTWGMALSEILTEEAISWAGYFNSLTVPEPADKLPYSVSLVAQPRLEKFPQKLVAEVSAENTGINTKTLYQLCQLLPKRHPDLKITVNDLLILYRSEFGHEYRPSSKIEDALFELRAQGTSKMQDIYSLISNTLIRSQVSNPALLIPMDATAANPRERLYPTTFRNHFTDLWANYQATSNALNQYAASQAQAHWAQFTKARRTLLAQLNYFGQLLRAYKKVALDGGSTSTATMKLLAHLPSSLMKLLDEIPRRIDVLNEVIKGEEVFSNAGRVARNSSLTRFISAKDDNENKRLVWGVLTDDDDVLHLSLRDFRHHVAVLHELGRIDLAEMIAKDYLDAFAVGFNHFVVRLLDILQAKATHAVPEAGE